MKEVREGDIVGKYTNYHVIPWTSYRENICEDDEIVKYEKEVKEGEIVGEHKHIMVLPWTTYMEDVGNEDEIYKDEGICLLFNGRTKNIFVIRNLDEKSRRCTVS